MRKRLYGNLEEHDRVNTVSMQTILDSSVHKISSPHPQLTPQYSSMSPIFTFPPFFLLPLAGGPNFLLWSSTSHINFVLQVLHLLQITYQNVFLYMLPFKKSLVQTI